MDKVERQKDNEDDGREQDGDISNEAYIRSQPLHTRQHHNNTFLGPF